jgi:hypothetical protein
LLVLDYARQRVASFLEEMRRLKDNDFPHPHSREALDLISQVIETRKGALDGLSPANSPDVIRNACAEAFVQILSYHPLLGFILRSTNIRNSFEVYRPILNLSRLILGNDTKLILSSEWEYSPFVYNPIADLPSFVLMGLPASESGNPLLTPLAGHELGHTTWQKKQVSAKYSATLADRMYKQIEDKWPDYQHLFTCNRNELRGDLFAARKLGNYHYLALKQAEESFCDFIGIRIFSESYLHAFAYLVAPGSAQMRQDKYPKIMTRVQNMVSAAQQYGTVCPADYAASYSDELDSTNHDHKLLMAVTDHAVSTVINDLIQEANTIVEAAGVSARDEALIQRAHNSFKLLVPASGMVSLANILNAGWIAYNDTGLWVDNEEVKKDRNHILYDIVLKSIEVLEFESITVAISGQTA